MNIDSRELDFYNFQEYFYNEIPFKIYFNQGRRLINHEVQIYNICEYYSRNDKFIGKFIQREDESDSDFFIRINKRHEYDIKGEVH